MADDVYLPRWASQWMLGEWVEDTDTVDWMRKLPSSVRELMLKFPPSCIVAANRELLIPSAGEVAIVTSYLEPNAEHPGGMVAVRQSPDSILTAECDPEWLRVVGFYQGITSGRVAELLEGK